MSRTQSPQAKRRRRKFDRSEILGLQTCSEILKYTRESHPTHNSFRKWIVLLKPSGITFNLNDIQRYEDAGKEDPYRDSMRTISEEYIRAIAPYSAYSTPMLLGLKQGLLYAEAVMCESTIDQLLTSYEEVLSRSSKLGEEGYWLCRQGKISKPHFGVIVEVTKFSSDLLRKAAISFLHKQRSLAMPANDFRGNLERFLHTYGLPEIEARIENMSRDRLKELLEEESVTPTEEEIKQLGMEPIPQVE